MLAISPNTQLDAPHAIFEVHAFAALPIVLFTVNSKHIDLEPADTVQTL